MAVSFNGVTIVAPGVASYIDDANATSGTVPVAGSFLAVIGEAVRGETGSAVLLQGLSQAEAFYGEGSVTAPLGLGIARAFAAGAPQVIGVRVGNATQAVANIKNPSGSNIFSLTAKEWGYYGNSWSVLLAKGSNWSSTNDSRKITLTRDDASTYTKDNISKNVLDIQYYNADTGVIPKAEVVLVNNVPTINLLATSQNNVPDVQSISASAITASTPGVTYKITSNPTVTPTATTATFSSPVESTTSTIGTIATTAPIGSVLPSGYSITVTSTAVSAAALTGGTGYVASGRVWFSLAKGTATNAVVSSATDAAGALTGTVELVSGGSGWGTNATLTGDVTIAFLYSSSLVGTMSSGGAIIGTGFLNRPGRITFSAPNTAGTGSVAQTPLTLTGFTDQTSAAAGTSQTAISLKTAYVLTYVTAYTATAILSSTTSVNKTTTFSLAAGAGGGTVVVNSVSNSGNTYTLGVTVNANTAIPTGNLAISTISTAYSTDYTAIGASSNAVSDTGYSLTGPSYGTGLVTRVTQPIPVPAATISSSSSQERTIGALLAKINQTFIPATATTTASGWKASLASGMTDLSTPSNRLDLMSQTTAGLNGTATTLTANVAELFDALNTSPFSDHFSASKQSAWYSPSVPTGVFAFSGATEVSPITPAHWASALEALENVDNVTMIVPMTASTSIQAAVLSHCQTMSGPSGKKERIAIFGGGTGQSVTDVKQVAATFNDKRAVVVWPGIKELDNDGNLSTWPPFYLAATIAGMLMSQGDPSQPLTARSVVLKGLETIAKPSVIDDLTANGVFAIRYDSGRGFTVAQSLTTWTGDLKFSRREISTVRCADIVMKSVRDSVQFLVGSKLDASLIANITRFVNTSLVYAQQAGLIVGSGTNPAFRDVLVRAVGDAVYVDFSISPAIPANYLLITAHIL